MHLGKTFLQGQQLQSLSLNAQPCRMNKPFVVEAKKLGQREKIRAKHAAQRRKGQDGTAERPRLAVYRSNNNIYAQVIDDSIGHTLAALSTVSKTVKDSLEGGIGANKSAAELVGKQLAQLCIDKNISKVFFDRGGLRYHGRIQDRSMSITLLAFSFTAMVAKNKYSTQVQ